jgi:hypothetical protein
MGWAERFMEGASFGVGLEERAESLTFGGEKSIKN